MKTTKEISNVEKVDFFSFFSPQMGQAVWPAIANILFEQRALKFRYDDISLISILQ